MDAHNAAEALEFLEQRGLEVYVDGGWAVEGGRMDRGLEWDSRRGYEFQEKQNRPNLCETNKSAE